MLDSWRFIEAASEGKVEECKSNAPTKIHGKEHREYLARAYHMAFRAAESGMHYNVVEWLVHKWLSLFDPNEFDTSDIASLYEFVSLAAKFAARKGEKQLLAKIWDHKQKFLLPGTEGMECVLARAFARGRNEEFNVDHQQSHLVAFIEAVRHGHMEMAEKLLSVLDIAKKDIDWIGRKLMLFCTYKDQPDLLKSSYDKILAARKEDWWHGEILTPLYLAAKAGSRKCSELALEYWGSQVDVNARYFVERFSALHVAAYYGHEDVVSLLLQQSSIQVELKDIIGRTPLHYASWQGHLPVVLQLLQELGSRDCNVGDENGMTPLQLAICANHTHVVRELLSKSDECLKEDYSRRARGYKLEKLQFLFDCHFQSIPSPPKHRFSKSLHIGELYEPPNLIDSVFWGARAFTSLHFAAALSDSEVLQQLLICYCHQELDDQVLDVLLLKDSRGFTAYQWAEAMKLGDAFLRCVEKCRGKEFVSEFRKKVGSKVLNVSNEINRFKQFKVEKKWCIDMCQALTEHDIDVATAVVQQAKCQQYNITRFGPTINGILFNYIFPNLKKLHPLWIANSLSQKCMVDNTSRSQIEELLILLGEVGKFTSIVLEMWLHPAIVFGFDRLAYQLIAIHKVNCNNPMPITHLIAPEALNKVSFHNVSPLKLAGMLNQRTIQGWMAEREDVKRGLYEDRQVYVDYANTILVGAVLIAGVAYQGWLQPPSGFDNDGYAWVDRHSSTMKLFWWLNSISFFLAAATVIAAGVGAMPITSKEHLVDAMTRVQSAVSVASVLFPLSMLCIMGAFATSGFTILPYHVYTYQLIMSSTMSCGALLCSLNLGWFMKRLVILLLDLNPNIKSTTMIKILLKKGASLLLGFSATTILLCCVELPYCLIVGPLLLLGKLAELCACSKLERAIRTALNSIQNYELAIKNFKKHHLYTYDEIYLM